jgi:hypothetical protein
MLWHGRPKQHFVALLGLVLQCFVQAVLCQLRTLLPVFIIYYSDAAGGCMSNMAQRSHV